MIRAALALAALAALACDDFRAGPLDGSIDDGGADASSPFTVIHAVPEGSLAWIRLPTRKSGSAAAAASHSSAEMAAPSGRAR